MSSAGDLSQSVADLHAAANVFFILVSGVLVFLMQCGFAALVAGSVRAKNCKSALILHALDCCVCALWWYLLGYANAFGSYADGSASPFIGTGFWALSSFPTNYTRGGDPDVFGTQTGTFNFFFFQYAFASAAATIVIGAVAERSTVVSYFCYSSLISAFVYPVTAHWVFSANGWLSLFNSGSSSSPPLLGSGLIDFAGSGVVHMTGGIAAGWGAYVLGPRIGRFGADGKPRKIASYSAALITLGTFLLWFGWYGFNPGSALSLTGHFVAVGRIAVVQTLSAGAAGLTGLFLRFSLEGHYPLETTMNSILAGLVGVTGSCAYIEPWAGIICGVSSACVYVAASALWIKLRIDDPVDAGPLHGVTGAWGVLFGALLAKREYLQEFATNAQPDANGLFYGGSDCWRYLVCAIVGILVIFGWVTAFVLPLFLVLRYAGLLRVPAHVELAGMDVTKHGGKGYATDKDDEADADSTSHYPGELSLFQARRSFEQRAARSSSRASPADAAAGSPPPVDDGGRGSGGARKDEIFARPVVTTVVDDDDESAALEEHDIERSSAARR